ncbi:hypothetical protein N7492_005904 [Penicillium capsulatum]|uniref:Uncharacterized protein n=1 Tax=Penicillium capsulatum TaxID=69766 RepID=A0A9W9IDA4_9EURO|nr:hypothetical protein N7492_005904 [Penicillium capsulatum]
MLRQDNPIVEEDQKPKAAKETRNMLEKWCDEIVAMRRQARMNQMDVSHANPTEPAQHLVSSGKDGQGHGMGIKGPAVPESTAKANRKRTLPEGLDEALNPLPYFYDGETDKLLFSIPPQRDLDWQDGRAKGISSSTKFRAAVGQRFGLSAPNENERCEGCIQGVGPFKSCRVVLLDQPWFLFLGACMCCAFNHNGALCSYRKGSHWTALSIQTNANIATGPGLSQFMLDMVENHRKSPEGQPGTGAEDPDECEFLSSRKLPAKKGPEPCKKPGKYHNGPERPLKRGTSVSANVPHSNKKQKISDPQPKKKLDRQCADYNDGERVSLAASGGTVRSLVQPSVGPSFNPELFKSVLNNPIMEGGDWDLVRTLATDLDEVVERARYEARWVRKILKKAGEEEAIPEKLPRGDLANLFKDVSEPSDEE